MGALVMMQKAPRRFGERRTERFELHDNQHYALTVDFQFHVPTHGPAPEEHDLLIPLGLFVKDRLPDLTVTGPEGERLPVLSRAERGQVVATLFGSRWQHLVFSELTTEQQEQGALEVWNQLLLATERIVTRPVEDADQLISSVRGFSAKPARKRPRTR